MGGMGAATACAACTNCCKASIAFMLLLAIGILSYTVFTADNEFKKGRDKLEKNQYTNGSIKQLKVVCKDLDDRIFDGKLTGEWSYTAVELGNRQSRACQDLVMFGEELRDLINRIEQIEHSSFGLLCSALVLVIISLFVQATAGKNYSKGSCKFCDIVILLIVVLQLLAAFGLMIYLCTSTCRKLTKHVNQGPHMVDGTYRHMIALNRQLRKDLLDTSSRYNQRDDPNKVDYSWWSFRQSGLLDKDYDIGPNGPKNRSANTFPSLEVKDCADEYNLTIVGVDAGLVIIIMITVIFTICIAAVIRPSQDDQQQLQLSYYEASSLVSSGYQPPDGSPIGQDGDGSLHHSQHPASVVQNGSSQPFGYQQQQQLQEKSNNVVSEAVHKAKNQPVFED